MKRTKIVTVCLLAMVFVWLGMFMLPVETQALKISGNYTISVAGNNCTITDFRTDIKGAVYIPSYLSGYKVVGIDEYAFNHCHDLTYISIPSTVTYIGDYAFANCYQVADFYIPSSVKTIGAHAFSGCAAVYSFGIPNSVTSIGDYAFAACHKITEFTIPDSVKTVGTGVFENCKALKSITVGRGVTSMGYMGDGCVAYTDLYIKDPNAWCNIQFVGSGSNPANYCKTAHILDDKGNEVKDLILDNTVTKIPIFTFNHFTNLTSVTIPESVTTVDEWAFLGCVNMTHFRVDENNAVYSTDDRGVLLSKNKKTLIVAPKGISGSYVLPDSVTTIDYSAFDKCNKLQIVIIGKGLTTIKSYAFRECTQLQSITIPHGVMTVGQCAFYECTSLADVYYAGSKTDWKAISISADNSCLTDANIHYNHIHDYTLLPAVTVKPTCTEAGYIEYTCVYGETYIEILDALGHEYTGSATVVKPTCTEDGHTVTRCIRCEDTETTYQTYLGHDYRGKETVVKPTCTEQGYTLTQCIRCDSIEKSDYVSALGHDYNGKETVVLPTCTDRGYTVVQCIRCDSAENKDYTDEMGHKMVLVPASEPTCTEPGLTAGTACQHCGLVGVAQKKADPATGHSYVDHEGKEPSCTAPGWEAYQTCDNCDYSTYKQLPMADHSYLNNEAKLPTCTEPGWEAYQSCKNCDYTNFVGLLPLGHRTTVQTTGLIDPFVITNDETYPYSFNNGSYYSTNHKDGSSSMLTITALYDCTLQLTYSVSSEPVYDKLYILLNGVQLDAIAGSAYKELTLTLMPGDVITVRYSKDSSTDGGADTVWVKLEYEKVPGTIFEVVSIDTLKPSCINPISCAYCNITVADHSYENNVCIECGNKKVDVKITSVTLRPSCAGLYFKGAFVFDEDVAVIRYGIAVSVHNDLPVADDSDEASLYTAGENSVLISNILGEGKFGKTLIYARAYALLEDGTYLYGDVVITNLKTVAEAIDTQWESLTAAQQEALTAMYRQFTTAMQNWLIPEIKKYA